MGLELIYFDVQGRATGIRIMLKMAGVDYKDTRVECDKAVWQAQKPDFDKLALGQLPIMKIDDRVYCQQDAIEEYCALKAGIVPKSAEDVMRVKMLLGKYYILSSGLLIQLHRNNERSWIENIHGGNSIHNCSNWWRILRSW